MKGLISGIKRMEIHDGEGLRTTVFFKGCPLQCLWCHNPESISPRPQIAKFDNKCIACGSCESVCRVEAIRVDALDFSRCTACGKCVDVCPTEALRIYGQEWEQDTLFEYLMQDAPFFRNGNGGVTFSGGECLRQANFAISLAKRFYDAGVCVDIDTCGYVSHKVLEKILPYTDTFLYDIKAVDSAVHRICTGKDNAIILDNLRYLSENNAKIEIRIPLVVGYNDTEHEGIGKFLSGLRGIQKIKVLRYHDYARSRYLALGMKDTLPEPKTENKDVEAFVNALRAYGLNAVNGAKDDGDASHP